MYTVDTDTDSMAHGSRLHRAGTCLCLVFSCSCLQAERGEVAALREFRFHIPGTLDTLIRWLKTTGTPGRLGHHITDPKSKEKGPGSPLLGMSLTKSISSTFGFSTRMVS